MNSYDVLLNSLRKTEHDDSIIKWKSLYWKYINKQSLIKRKGGCICMMINFCCNKPAKLQSGPGHAKIVLCHMRTKKVQISRRIENPRFRVKQLSLIKFANTLRPYRPFMPTWSSDHLCQHGAHILIISPGSADNIHAINCGLKSVR